MSDPVSLPDRIAAAIDQADADAEWVQATKHSSPAWRCAEQVLRAAEVDRGILKIHQPVTMPAGWGCSTCGVHGHCIEFLALAARYGVAAILRGAGQ